MQFTLIGNPENRRCQYFIAALKSQGFRAPFVVSYLDILQQKIDLNKILAQTDHLRIESPGENRAVSNAFLKLGVEHPLLGRAPSINCSAIQQLPFEKGRIQFLRQNHLGFVVFLDQLQQAVAAHSQLRLMNGIEGIKLMFDKTACHQHFSHHNISVPLALYNIQNYEDLRSKMQIKSWQRVFIKPIHGSSASGVIAFRTKGDRVQAITSVELVQEQASFKLFNSLKTKTYSNTKEIAYLVDTLAKEGIIVEQWIPKASLEGGAFDLRMVVIGGKTQQVVVRQSHSPMTNLHLGNQRGTIEEVKAVIGLEKWQEMSLLAEKAASTLPETLYTGMDVMISSTLKKIVILEANAFGDLLPNVLINGMDTYATTLSTIKNRL
ncbi:MAG: STM4014 family protein [Aureispira sp.]|nr:STM4014 family protein [Aureispira sp.]